MIHARFSRALHNFLGDERSTVPPDFASWAQFLHKRREQLLEILRKSIALNEPLLCSL